MSERERSNIHAENLLGAGKRYGDACVACDNAIRAWHRGLPRIEMDAATKESSEAQIALCRAARAYATRMRSTAKRLRAEAGRRA